MKYLQTSAIEERGILTSIYKQQIKKSVRLEKSKSLSSIKSLVLNHHGKIESQTGTILQVSLFAFLIIMTIS
ncbi:hypothetical protein BTO04_07050 [Polaribacter sp. SA4-10]|uniref:hypothetical protein n=1 Tax=Polaribacter sp. SA4-10 TaxID=754397 RepID=UPI000B3C4D85|nr:hypothetical protein [Polaribacter sp. SA4-10]ARV06469.1 hypothetical protein BTO04_07050 [Polaribacter sp. SA4-10]